MATKVPSNLDIAQAHTLQPIADIAERYGLEPDDYDLYGKYKAKVDLSVLDRLAGRDEAPIVCVTAITPTKAGEGKTTTSVATRSSACESRRSARCSASRAVPPGAASPRSSRWRT